MKILTNLFKTNKTTKLQQTINNLETHNRKLQAHIENLKNINTTTTNTNTEYLKTIKTLGEKDKERTQKIQQLQNENTNLNKKIAIMRQDMDTQVQFMEVIQAAINSITTGLEQLPDNMPSLNTDFHNYNPISNMENPPYKEITQELIEQIANPQPPEQTTPAKPFYNDPQPHPYEQQTITPPEDEENPN